MRESAGNSVSKKWPVLSIVCAATTLVTLGLFIGTGKLHNGLVTRTAVHDYHLFISKSWCHILLLNLGYFEKLYINFAKSCTSIYDTIKSYHKNQRC